MAAIDTILVLDGIQHAKDNADKVWTLDGDGIQYEAVRSYVIALPSDISGARVIFNGNYDPDGARHHVRCKYTALTASTPTKTENTQALEWTIVDPDTSPRIVETGAIDVSGCLQGSLHIDVAISEAEATTGLEVIVQIRKEAALDEWTDLCRFVGPIGTGVIAAFSGDEAAAQTTLSITNPTAAHLNHIGKFIFLEDVNTIANCEIAYIVECGADA